MSELQYNLDEILRQKNQYIIPSNIKQGVTIFGIEGNLSDKPDQTKTCTPSDSQQIIEPDTGYELASVTVNAVDITTLNDYQTCDAIADTILGQPSAYKVTYGLLYELDTFLYQQRDIDTEIDQTLIKSEYTIFISLQPHSWSNYKGVIGYHGGNAQGICGFQYVDGEIPYGHIENSYDMFPYIGTTNQLYNLIVTFADNKLNIWCNGTKVYNNVTMNDIRPYSTIRLGRAYAESNRYFDGEMGYCYIYNRCLSSYELEAMSEYIEDLQEEVE